MDVIKFVETQRRMCDMYGECHGCPLEFDYCRLAGSTKERDEEIISIVEKWAAENPIKTRQSEFLRLFPNARMLKDGRCLDICPQNLENDINCPEHGDCAECACQYWLKEIE